MTTGIQVQGLKGRRKPQHPDDNLGTNIIRDPDFIQDA